jgi:hypothetical protein
MFDRRVASALKCPNKAFIVEFVKWSCEQKEQRAKEHPHEPTVTKDGQFYMWDTFDAWHARMPWLSIRTIKTYVADLRQKGWIKAEHLSSNKSDRTLYYAINTDMYAECRNCTIDVSAQPDDRICTIDSAETAPSDDAEIALSSSPNTLTKIHTKSPPPSEKPAPSKQKRYEPEDKQLAAEWHEYATFEMPWHDAPASWSIHKFAQEIAKVKRVMKISHNGLEELLAFVRQDDFWSKNALSPASLLNRSKNGNRKIENILIAARPKQDKLMAQLEQHQSTRGKIDVDRLTDGERAMFDLGIISDCMPRIGDNK